MWVRLRFKTAAERQLQYFEEELQADLVRLAALRGESMISPHLVARRLPVWCSPWRAVCWICRETSTQPSGIPDRHDSNDPDRRGNHGSGVELGNHRGPRVSSGVGRLPIASAGVCGSGDPASICRDGHKIEGCGSSQADGKVHG